MGCGISPILGCMPSGESAWRFSLSAPPPPLACALSKANENIFKKKKSFSQLLSEANQPGGNSFIDTFGCYYL